ncbi:MAG: hypothetical protein LBU81_02740 [Methanosarcinales archaeon]|jgi:hypothetical protein|nr:hypothetical protein [Methanosarcinales archaeon]
MFNKSNKKIIMGICLMMFFGMIVSPAALAQENKKVSSDFSVTQLNDPNAAYLSQEDLSEYEELIYMLLEADGVTVNNLNLSNVKKLDNDANLILAGKISYDIVSVDLKSADIKLSDDFIASSLQSQELNIYTCFNKTDNTLKMESSSGKNQYYELNLNKETNSNGKIEYVFKESFIVDGNVNTFENVISSPTVSKSVVSNPNNNILAAPASGWINTPGNPPSNSILAYNDGKLSSLITAGSIVASVVAGVLVAATTAGVGGLVAGAITSVVVGIATYLVSNLLPAGVSADFVYVDYYFTVYPRPFYNASPAIGYAHPTVPVYGEIDRYYQI